MRASALFGVFTAVAAGTNELATKTNGLQAVYWDLQGANLTIGALDDYEAQALVYSLQGIVNRPAPSLFFDTGDIDKDFPASEKAWRSHLEAEEGVSFAELPPTLCALVDHFTDPLAGAIIYPSDGFSTRACRK